MQKVIQRTRKIVCLLKNYEAHAAEMKSSAPKEPDYFLKPTTSLLVHKDDQPFAAIQIPNHVANGSDVHHEVELGVVIGSPGKNIAESDVSKHISGFFLALDMTARTIQTKAKEQGRPWTVAKGFDTFCAVGDEFIERDQLYNASNNQFKPVNLYLKINGQMKQHGSTKDMIFSIEKSIASISKVMTLEEGDLILTGTPEGVGPVFDGKILFHLVVTTDSLTTDLQVMLLRLELRDSQRTIILPSKMFNKHGFTLFLCSCLVNFLPFPEENWKFLRFQT